MYYASFILIFILLFSGCNSSDKGNEQNPVLDNNITKVDDFNLSIEAQNYRDLRAGENSFSKNCAICHGSDAKGSAGPDVVGITQVEIQEAILGIGDMSYMQGVVLEDEQRRIALYLTELNKVNPTNDVDEKDKALLGKKLFFDTSFSLNRTLSCASCHDREHAFIDARYDTNPVGGALSVGDDGVTLGGRNAPTITYAKFIPDFLQLDNETYLGGQFWDGRAKNLQAQAKGPFLDHAEMMMPSANALVQRVKENSVYVEELKRLYGSDVFNKVEDAYSAVAQSIAKFEKTPEFATFDSKFDRSKLPSFNANYYEMSKEEKLGYSLFFSKEKTHCASCHSINSGVETSVEVFSNFKYENIGIPKNSQALLTRDGHTNHTDLGLGGRADINSSLHYGKTKVPTLRNIAVTAPYMNNGIFKELATVIKYFLYMAGHNYPINPETNQVWEVAEINSTVNHKMLHTLSDLNEEEIDALESFLKLLTDKRYETHIK